MVDILPPPSNLLLPSRPAQTQSCIYHFNLMMECCCARSIFQFDGLWLSVQSLQICHSKAKTVP